MKTVFVDIGGYGMFAFLLISSSQATCTISAVVVGNFSVILFPDATFFQVSSVILRVISRYLDATLMDTPIISSIWPQS